MKAHRFLLPSGFVMGPLAVLALGLRGGECGWFVYAHPDDDSDAFRAAADEQFEQWYTLTEGMNLRKLSTKEWT